MINTTFIGNIFHSDGTPANDVKYQALFIKVNPNSTDTLWDSTRVSETNQYNINLGDNTWLSQQGGYAQPFDKVVLAFWLPTSTERQNLDIDEWSFIEWILDDRDVYVQNVQLMGAGTPTCSFSLSGNTANREVHVIDEGTRDEYQWIFEGKEHYQQYQWDGHIIFPISKLPDYPLTIDWGDGTTETPLPLSGSPFPHIYTGAGDYKIDITVLSTSSLECSASAIQRVIYKVDNGLIYPEPAVIGESTLFQPDIGGELAVISGVDYYIDGILTHTDLTYNETFEHTFTTEGNHTVRQCIKYNNGFTNEIQCEDFIVELDTLANYVSSEYDCGLVFTDTSMIGAPPVVKYQWDVTDGLFLLAHVEGSEYSEWYYSWPYKGTFQVRMAVADSNGRTSSISKEYVVDECIGDGSSSGGGGGGSPWVYQETAYKTINQPVPTLHIVNIEDCDLEPEKKKILILEIVEDV